MVADDAALEDVMLGPDGAVAALPRGAIHISMSTISPALSRRLAERHETAGQTYVAAPVFGRPEAAEAKQLWIVAAGPSQALERIGPVLDAMGQGVIVAGDDPPRANVIKLAGNFLLAAAIEAMGEARSEEHTSELQSHSDLVCRLLLEKKKMKRRCTLLSGTR